ncbi:Sec-independent protein translocase subunit TatA/TatB [Flavobacterium sp. ARAG 55.4]|uniref:Twin-arginine translocase TatA/TatE family subunit n=1 Tax=Flavobacterium plantiphilum TaxID=3163297 RepID=A0ABW8XTP3_9FLAO
MFGIGGGELVFIMFIVLLLFGSDKIPEVARTMGKAMAQLKNATNDIKSEIQKGAEENGLDSKSLTEMTGGFNSQINKVKDDLLGDSVAQAAKMKEDIEDIAGPVKRSR